MTALEKHIEEMSSNPLFEGTDFKLASCEDPIDERVARECGFTSLSVRVVKVVVSSSSRMVSPFIIWKRRRAIHYLVLNCCCIGWQELVTLCSNPTSAPPEISSAGRHLSAAEFHSVLQNVGEWILRMRLVHVCSGLPIPGLGI